MKPRCLTALLFAFVLWAYNGRGVFFPLATTGTLPECQVGLAVCLAYQDAHRNELGIPGDGYSLPTFWSQIYFLCLPDHLNPNVPWVR